MEEGHFAGTVKKETLTTNNNQKKKKKADKAALFRSFEQWMSDYSKVYLTEAEKARRFKYFKDTVGYIEDYNKVHGGEDSLELDEFAADSPKEKKKKKKEADEAALFRSFERWMAEYGKVYPTEAEKARRFEYFKDTVVYIEDYNKVHGGLELDEFAADSPKEQCGQGQGQGQYQEYYTSLSRLDEVFFG